MRCIPRCCNTEFIDRELYYELHYLSRYEGRSANGEVLYLIRQAIERFEAEHGKIELPAEPDP